MEEEAATTSADWIGLGDRSHPNLRHVDILKKKLTYEGHENDLKELEKAHFTKGGLGFKNILHRIRETEKLSKGDRSHPNLVRLDKLMKKLTYDGWRDDVQEAEKKHLYSPFDFEYVVRRIERKKKVSVGDRSDKDLKFLDSLRLTYPGWEKDWQQAFDHYIGGFTLRCFGFKFCLTEKQRMHEGDRSHPRLVALDSLKLTYPGWQKDAHKYEQKHVCLGLNGFEMLIGSPADTAIAILKSKQQRYCGIKGASWMLPDQRTIVNTQWTFPGCKEQVKYVLGSTSQNFAGTLEHFQLRQMMHDEDYSNHPLLIKLKSMKFSYPGWEKDINNAKRELYSSLTMWKDSHERNMQEMQNKQTVYDGYVRSLKKETMTMGEQKEEEETGLKECVICWSAPRTHVFVPCGHMCACKSCSETLIENRKVCPACNQASTMAIEVFMP